MFIATGNWAPVFSVPLITCSAGCGIWQLPGDTGTAGGSNPAEQGACNLRN